MNRRQQTDSHADIRNRRQDIMQGNDDLSMSGLPPANGTDDRGARPLVWVAAFTKSNAERTAAAALRREDYSVYIPVSYTHLA